MSVGYLYRQSSFRYLRADNNYSKHKYFLHIRNSLFSLNQLAILVSIFYFPYIERT